MIGYEKFKISKGDFTKTSPVLIVVIMSAIVFAGCIEESETQVGGLPSNFAWSIDKEYNIFTAETRIDDLDNMSSVSNRALSVDSTFVLYDANEWVQFYDMELVENKEGNFVLSSSYEGDISLKTEKVNLTTGEVLSSTPFQTWNGSRTFPSEDIVLSPGEALVVVLTWKI